MKRESCSYYQKVENMKNIQSCQKEKEGEEISLWSTL